MPGPAGAGAGRPARLELERYRDATVPDLLGDDVRLLLVGINPGLWTAAVQAHFARPGNRFYPALHLGGITGHLIDASRGFTPEAIEELTGRGIGISNLVERATARADELTADELRAGAEGLRAKVGLLRPAVVGFVGITAYRTAFTRPKAILGRQPEPLGEAEVWALPNPSGLNAHHDLATMARWYREAADAAGVPCATGASG